MAGMNGRVIGGFRILQTIQDEASGQGQVYRAVCEDDQVGFVPKGRVVALKVMPVQGDDRQAWQKLEKRTRELALMDHPGIVKYYGCFTAQGEWSTLHVVVQEYLKGETLKERLRRFPSGLDVDEALKIADATLSALVYTSGRGIVHRDVKPGNIFLCESAIGDGRVGIAVKLIDFEIAKQQNGTATTATGAFQGSLNYMAPELLSKEFRGDTVSDIFSMGVVLHEMLTGSLPYDEIDYNERDAILDFVSRWKDYPSGKNPIEISRNINRILVHTGDLMMKSLAPDRADRFASFEAFQAELGKVRFRVLSNQENGNSYKMLQIIGKGGFGEVFKARDAKSGRLVAVKHLLRHKYLDRFVREAKIISKFDDDRLVKFVEYFDKEMDGRPQAFLVMSFLDGMPGSSLRDAIKRADEMPVRLDDVAVAFIRYAQGLKALHARGIFHRDIKPSNLYYPYGRPERAAIMDLGIARDTQGTLTFGDRPGTPDYMPYEVFTAEKPSDSGVDIYALGLCLYEALTARFPFPRLPGGIQGYQKLIERANDGVVPTIVLDDVANCRAAFKALIRDMTEIDPARRIQDADVVCFRLRSILKELRQCPQPHPSPPPKPPVPPEPSASPTRRPAIVAAVAAVVVIAVAAVVAFPRAKSAVAEWQLGKVVELYERGAIEDAVTRELIWIREWNPESLSLCTLGHDEFVAATNRIADVKSRQAAASTLQKCIKMLASCKGADGVLDEEAYERLDGWTPPEQVDRTALRETVGLETSIVNAVRLLLDYNGDVTTRASRLDRAKKLFSNSLTQMMLAPTSYENMGGRIDAAEAVSVGEVVNRCSGDIEVGDGKIVMSGKRSNVVLKRDEVEKNSILRRGFEPLPLPLDFDGRVYTVDETSFTAQPVKVTVPALEDGVVFRIGDNVYTGGEELSLRPGTYRGKYERSDEFEVGRKTYKDVEMEFAVFANTPVAVPVPGEWRHSEAYDAYKKGLEETGRETAVHDKLLEVDRLLKSGNLVAAKSNLGKIEVIGKENEALKAKLESQIAKLMRPVAVEIDGREEGVNCEIDGVMWKKNLKLTPGDHVVVYSKDDYVTITNAFTVEPGQIVQLTAPRLQEGTALKALAQAREAFNKNELDIAESELARATVVGKENEQHRQELEGKIKEAKQELEQQRQTERRNALTQELAQKIADSPIETRRARLGKAKQMVADSASQELLGAAAIKDWLNRIALCEARFVGEVVNSCDAELKVGGQSLRPGASLLLGIDAKGQNAVDLRLDGYEPLKLKLDFDGRKAVVSRAMFVISDVEVKVPALEPEVECWFDGQKVASSFKVKPGACTCVYRRSGYEDQQISFSPKVGEGRLILPKPSSWTVLPVAIKVPPLDSGVTCTLNGERISDHIMRAPGRCKVVYSKVDCVSQEFELDVKVGTPVDLPQPKEWEASAGVKNLDAAETAMAKDDWDKVNSLLPKIVVVSADNRARKAAVSKWVSDQKERREREKEINDLVADAQFAFSLESWMDVLEKFFKAQQGGYVLTEGDKELVKKAYQKEMKNLTSWQKRVERDIAGGKRPFMNPLVIEEKMNMARTLYRELTRARE